KRDPAPETRLRIRLGNLYVMLGDYETAAVYFEQARDQAKTLSDISAESMATAGLGAVYRYVGKWSDAKKAFERSLELSRQRGNRFGEAMHLRNIGNLEFN